MGKKDAQVFTSCLALSDILTGRLGPYVLHEYFILSSFTVCPVNTCQDPQFMCVLQ